MRSRQKRIEAVYRREGDAYLIEVNLRDPRQLFNGLDPAPFRDRDLEEAAEYYIVEAVRDLGARTRTKLIVYLPFPTVESAEAQTIPAAVRNYFSYRTDHMRRDLRDVLREGLVSLGIGFGFLFLCLTAREFLALGMPAGAARDILQEGLIILGWVAMWRPAQLLLYDWWPIAARRGLFRAIQRLPIEVRPRAEVHPLHAGVASGDAG